MKPEDVRAAATIIEQIRSTILQGTGRLKGKLYDEVEDIIEPNGEGRWIYTFCHGTMNRDRLTLIRAAFADELIIDHSLTHESFVRPWEGFFIYNTIGAATYRRDPNSSPRDCLGFYEQPAIPYQPPDVERWRRQQQQEVPLHAMGDLAAFRGSIQRPS